MDPSRKISLKVGHFGSLPSALFYQCSVFIFIYLLSVLYNPDIDSFAEQANERTAWRNVTFTPWSSFVLENEYMVYNKSYDNTVHLLTQVKLDSDLFRWRPPPSLVKTTPQTKQQRCRGYLSCLAHIPIFRVALEHRAVYVTLPACGLWCWLPLWWWWPPLKHVGIQLDSAWLYKYVHSVGPTCKQ
jgi:hypothetical protein